MGSHSLLYMASKGESSRSGEDSFAEPPHRMFSELWLTGFTRPDLKVLLDKLTHSTPLTTVDRITLTGLLRAVINHPNEEEDIIDEGGEVDEDEDWIFGGHPFLAGGGTGSEKKD